MNSNTLKFNIAIVLILVYELSMVIFHLDGVSVFKYLLTLLIWISFGIALLSFIENYKLLKLSIPKSALYVLGILLLWNISSIFISLVGGQVALTTLLGNLVTALALLVPFVIIFSLRMDNLRILRRYFIKVLSIGVVLFCLFYITSGGGLNNTQIRILLLFLQPTIFLITVLPYENNKTKILIVVSGVLLFYVSSLFGGRTMMLRELLLFVSITAIYFYQKFNFKWILSISYLLLLIPFALLLQSMNTGESALEMYLSPSSENELTTDTRTFLYIEVFNDLVNNDKLIIGKGAGGTYFSEYFSIEEGDSANRLDIEVGILAMLLKGGMISVVLNITLLIMAIYFAFFQSNNYYVIGLGFILLVHVILLFIENIISYTTYNFIIWFFIGACISKDFRRMSNSEILEIFYPKMSAI